MERVKKKVSKDLRNRILAESSKIGCVKVDLARSYGISEKTLYKWRSKARKEMSTVHRSEKFVELMIERPPLETFKKAELVIGDCVLLMEGKFSSAKLISILKILEAAC